MSDLILNRTFDSIDKHCKTIRDFTVWGASKPFMKGFQILQVFLEFLQLLLFIGRTFFRFHTFDGIFQRYFTFPELFRRPVAFTVSNFYNVQERKFGIVIPTESRKSASQVSERPIFYNLSDICPIWGL